MKHGSWKNKITEKELRQMKVGDDVMVISSKESVRIATVIKITMTMIITSLGKFDKKSGGLIGLGIWGFEYIKKSDKGE